MSSNIHMAGKILLEGICVTVGIFLFCLFIVIAVVSVGWFLTEYFWISAGLFLLSCIIAFGLDATKDERLLAEHLRRNRARDLE